MNRFLLLTICSGLLAVLPALSLILLAEWLVLASLVVWGSLVGGVLGQSIRRAKPKGLRLRLLQAATIYLVLAGLLFIPALLIAHETTIRLFALEMGASLIPLACASGALYASTAFTGEFRSWQQANGVAVSVAFWLKRIAFTDPHPQGAGRPRALWLDLLAIAAGLTALWCFVAPVLDAYWLNYIFSGLGIAPTIVAWGLWFRRSWGRSLCVFIGWLVCFMPPTLVTMGYASTLGGADSIGGGIMVAAGILGTFVVSPLAVLLVWILTRPKTKALFGEFAHSDPHSLARGDSTS